MSGGWSRAESPFHPGEREMQQRMGLCDTENWARKGVRDHLPEQHQAFHTALPFLVVAARDAWGRPWATLPSGPEGFVAAPDPRSLVIDADPVRGDALEGALTAGADLGILGIELASRRRNRVNGRITEGRAGGLVFAAADTLFITSGYRAQGESATFGMDASHRGGDRGFVGVDVETRLVFPD